MTEDQDTVVPLLHAMVSGIDEELARWNETLPKDWESFSLVIGLNDGEYAQAYGYGYGPGETWVQAVSLDPHSVEDQLEVFLADRYSGGQVRPVKVLFQLRLTDGRYDVQYEDSDRERWKVSPATIRQIREELRPVFDDVAAAADESSAATEFSDEANSAIAHLHDIVHATGWDAPVAITWRRADAGTEDGPPYAALDELAGSGLFTVSNTDAYVTLRFADAGRAHYGAADLQAAIRVGEEKLPLTTDTIATFATLMLAMPWQESDDPDDPAVEWHLGGYEGSSAFGFLHVMVLGDEAVPAQLAELTPPTIAVLAERWGESEWTEVASLPEFDPSNPTGPSMLRLTAMQFGATGLQWWRASADRLFLLGIREEEPEPSRLVMLWVVPPELLEQQESPEPALPDQAQRRAGSARTLQRLLGEEAPSLAPDVTAAPPRSDHFVISVAEQMVELPWPESEDSDEHPSWKIEKLRGRTAYGIAHQLKFDWAVTRSEKVLSAERLAGFDARFGAHQSLDLDALPEYDPTAEELDMRALLALILRDTGATRALRWQATGRRILLAGIEDDRGGVVARFTRRAPAGTERLTGLVVVPPEMFEEPGRAAPRIRHEDVAGMELSEVAALAMRYPWTDEERKAFRSPPYPLPAGLVPAIEVLEAALPADHEERRRERISRADETYVPSSFFSGSSLTMARAGLPAAVLSLISHGVLDDARDIEFLISTAHDLEVPEMDRDLVVRDLLLHLVEAHLMADDVRSAEQAADRVSEVVPATAHYGWREIAAHHAANGNVTAFLDAWGRYDARQDRTQVRQFEERLVRSVAVREGWQAAIEATADRRFGEAFRRHAFDARAYGYDDLVTLFAGEAAGVLDETGELHALVAAANNETPRPPTADHHGVEDVLARVAALDPEVSNEAMRVRDELLLSLRGAVGDEETLDRLRAQVRTPRLAREIDEVRELLARPKRLSFSPTHIVMSNGDSKGPLIDNLRPYPEQIRFSLSRMNGDTFWAYCLWRAPADANLLEELPRTGEYLQCAGTAEALTVEWRRVDAGGVTHQYTVGKPDAPQDGDPVRITWDDGVPGTDVHPHEVFTADEAAEIFYAYFRTDAVPETYLLRELAL